MRLRDNGEWEMGDEAADEKRRVNRALVLSGLEKTVTEFVPNVR
jgi:hypothetical protein